MPNYIAKGRQVVIPLTNKAANAVEYGDVVILDTTATESFDVTTTENYSDSWIGVVVDQDGIAVDAIGRVCVSGYVADVNLDGAAAIGDFLFTDSVAEQGTPNAARGEGAFGQALEASATPSAYIWGNPDGAGGGGDVATDTIWDAAGDLVQGTGADAAAKLSIGTYPQILRVNSGATAAEWVSAGRIELSSTSPVGTNVVTLNPIAATYNDIQIVLALKSDNVAAAVNLYLEFNADSTAGNYRYIEHYAAPGGHSTNSGDDHIITTGLAAAGGVANAFTVGTIIIPYYASSTIRKHAIAEFSNRRASGSGLELIRYNTAIEWESTSAITRIDLTASAGNYIAGSNVRIYGAF